MTEHIVGVNIYEIPMTLFSEVKNMPSEEKCFIIMPITTPENLVKVYRDGKEHFQHILDCLLIPAVERAGYIVVPPQIKGSDLIHAEIINSLQSSDIVLCDISGLNPNVFFEFGIRTSLNKPVSLIKDEWVTQIPFDTKILNCHEYKSSIEPWELQEEIEKVSTHIKTCMERSKGENTLWKYFGFKSGATPYKGEIDADSKLSYIFDQLDLLNRKIDGEVDLWSRGLRSKSVLFILRRAFPDIKFQGARLDGNLVYVDISHDLPESTLLQISKYIESNFNRKAIINNLPLR